MAALLALAQSGCGEPPPRHLVLVTLDTLRADRLGAYGYERDTSPFLDGLARRGIRFGDAIAQSTTTPPSHATILTGLNPPRHGLRRLYGQRLPAANETLAEILQQAGFETAAFVSALPLRAAVGLDQGFDVYDDEVTDDARATNEKVYAWLRKAGPVDRLFLWIHYFDPHVPYFPPEDFRIRFGVDRAHREFLPPPINTNPATRPRGSRAKPPNRAVPKMSKLYDAEIGYMDHSIGELFDALRAAGILDDAIVAVVADHGEQLGEQGYYFGHWDVLDWTARVPMILVHPKGRHAGRIVEESVGTIDLVPTLLSWLGVASDIDFDGRDLSPLFEGGDLGPRFFYTDQFEYYGVRALRNEDWLLIQRARPNEPLQKAPIRLHRRGDPELLHVERPDLVAELGAQLLETGRSKQPSERLEMPQEIRDRLRALGYAADE